MAFVSLTMIDNVRNGLFLGVNALPVEERSQDISPPLLDSALSPVDLIRQPTRAIPIRNREPALSMAARVAMLGTIIAVDAQKITEDPWQSDDNKRKAATDR